jgi:hypothetical protein
MLLEKERAHVQNEWLKWRLENIIPELMRRDSIRRYDLARAKFYFMNFKLLGTFSI